MWNRIGPRLLAFNLLVLFLPVAGILYLDVYEQQLLDAQERGMVQQGRLVAAAVGGADVLSATAAHELLARFAQQGDARIRIYDAAGALVADSLRWQGPARGVQAVADRYTAASSSGRDAVLYRIGAWLASARRVISRSPGEQPREPPQDLEVRAALDGRYGAATRPTPGQRSLTLTSAVPIRSGDRIIGAVLVSQSTFRVLQALYDVRLRVFEIVVACAVAAVLLSLAVSATVVWPLTRLRREAMALADRRHTFTGFRDVNRPDEIGDLSRALDDLTRRLDAHIRLLEAFAADVSHEFKNPLASIRSAAEMLAQTDREADRDRFLAMLIRDVDRLERLVSGVRELAIIDGQLAHEPLQKVNVTDLLGQIIDGLRISDGGTIALHAVDADSCFVRAAPDRLAQVFENLLQNARGFSPPGGSIDVSIASDRVYCRARVEDRGPGIPPAHLDRVFDRFFTYRPHERTASHKHAGLGLAIARTIVEGYGGTITASNRRDGGACFDVRLPLATMEREVRQISAAPLTAE